MTGAVSIRRPVTWSIAGLVLALAWCEPAGAGTYAIRSCNVPGYAPAPAAPWQWEYALHTVAFDECAAGGGFGLAFQNTRIMKPVSVAALRIVRPVNGPKSAIGLRRVRLWMIARLNGTGSLMFAVTTTTRADGSLQQTDLFGKPGGDTLQRPYVSPILPSDLSRFRVVLACSGSTYGNCFASHMRPLEIRGAELTLEEEVSPAGDINGGTLVSGGRQSGVRTLNYDVRDHESGVAKIEGLLGDTVVGVRNFAAECRYSDFSACPSRRNDDLVVDTRLVPDGAHTLRLRVTDAAGNRFSAQPPGAIRVANGNTTRGNLRLEARFAGKAGAAATTRFGRRVTIRGRLSDISGHGIRNGRVEVVERRLSTGTIDRAKHIVTAADGKFNYRVPRGPSRAIQLQSRGVVDNVLSLARRTLRLRVKAAAILRIGLRGVRVRYAGRVLSKPFPRRGKLVLLQGRARGGSWQSFATRRVHRRGRFSGRYRLRVYRPGITLQFRVRVPAQSGYPYIGGGGRPVTRKVK